MAPPHCPRGLVVWGETAELILIDLQLSIKYSHLQTSMNAVAAKDSSALEPYTGLKE